MIDSPQNCFLRAEASRRAAEGPMLESVRLKYLTSADAWEGLARILLAKTGNRHALPLSKLPELLLTSREDRRGVPDAIDDCENEGGALPT